MARVVFWLGPTIAGKFDPRTAIGTGIGGSETAAIHLTRELAALGHEVLVFADVVGQGTHQGVEWRHGNDFPADLPCDLFISSRHPEALRALRPRCRRKWLWVHDLHCGPDWEGAIGDYDRVLCLTRWAREKFLAYYPGQGPAKVCQTSNAVDLTAFSGHPGRPGDQHLYYQAGKVPLRATYSSSPDRGLDELLDLWDAVRSMVAPRLAELHVYYGFETWKRLAELHDSDVERSRVERLEARLMDTAGVYHHGRAGQHEVARSYMQSQLWLYPTDFLETSCITAMEAQAAHCKIVATKCGALPETAPGAWFVDGPTTRPGYRAAFLANVHAALCDDSVVVQTPRTWMDVAREWDGWLRGEIFDE